MHAGFIINDYPKGKLNSTELFAKRSLPTGVLHENLTASQYSKETYSLSEDTLEPIGTTGNSLMPGPWIS